jgi:murein DD-endopeptidase MepM/ murein hydrolase activator NlpD
MNPKPQNRRRNIRLLGILALLICSCALAGAYLWRRSGGRLVPPQLPLISTALPYTPWPTPPTVQVFDYPLLPAESYAPYVQGVTGPLAVSTGYGVQNPAQGDRSNCFQDVDGNDVPFRQLYHAGIDLFALGSDGQIAWGQAAHAPVHAVADGVVIAALDAGSEGYIVIVEHLLVGGGSVYSVYWHVDHVQVQPGQPVTRGQVIAVVKDLGLNSHLHWEMRTFGDGSDLFPAGTAGARGRCNGHFAGVGYTWDDDPARAHPDFYGYLDPTEFVQAHLP